MTLQVHSLMIRLLPLTHVEIKFRSIWNFDINAVKTIYKISDRQKRTREDDSSRCRDRLRRKTVVYLSLWNMTTLCLSLEWTVQLKIVLWTWYNIRTKISFWPCSYRKDLSVLFRSILDCTCLVLGLSIESRPRWLRICNGFEYSQKSYWIPLPSSAWMCEEQLFWWAI